MARTGLFGRSPRAVPSLTATLLSVARAQQNQEDQNIMDAWQKGGMFEGKKATDEAVLAHWRMRLKDISKDDALYDTYKNVITQYEYSIAESKMTVQYAQGHIHEKEAAAFYLNWAKRIPQDSEFYRVLQRDAAQYINAAKNKAAANANKLKEQAYQNSQTATDKKYNAAGDYLTNVLTNIARANAIIGPNEDPGKFDLSDPHVMLHLITTVNKSAGNEPSDPKQHLAGTEMLFVDPQTGKAVTAAEVKDQLHALDPHFTGQVSLDYYAGLLRQKQEGLGIMLAAASKTGHATDASRITQDQYATVSTAQGAAAWPIEEAVQKARDVFLSTWSDPSVLSGAKVKAYDTYMGALNSIANDPKRVPDPALKHILMAEYNGNGNIESLATQMGAAKPGDSAVTRAWADNFRHGGEEVAAGKAVWTVGSFDSGTGEFIPGKGKDIGAADPAAVKNLSSIPAVTVYLPQGFGLPDIAVQVVGQPVTAKVFTSTGTAVPTTTSNEQAVGTVYNLPGGAMYGFPGKDGKTVFTRTPPWAAGVQAHTGANGSVELNIIADPKADNAAFAVSGADSNTGQPTYSVHPGSLAFDAVRIAGNGNPLIDSFSPTVAFRISETEGPAGLRSLLSNNPDFQRQLEFDAHVYGAGQSPQFDPKTGAVIGWQGGSPTAATTFSQALSAVGQLVLPTDNSADESVRAMHLQSRAPGDMYTTSAGQHGSVLAKAPLLPADSARALGASFGALTSIFIPGTTTIAPPTAAQSPGPSISTGLKLNVPNIAGTLPPLPTVTPPVPASTNVFTAPFNVPTTPYTAPNSSGSPDDRNGGGTGYTNGAR